jgi:L-iditol 2-dehydrogenase
MYNHPGELSFSKKLTPVPGRAEVLMRIDTVAICATDLEITGRDRHLTVMAGEGPPSTPLSRT